METKTYQHSSFAQKLPRRPMSRGNTMFMPLRGTSYLERQRKRIRSAPGRLVQVKDVRKEVISQCKLNTTEFAFFTLVTDDASVPSALILAWSLRKTSTNYDLVAMVTEHVSVRMVRYLRFVYTRVEAVDYIASPCHRQKVCGLAQRHDRDQYLYSMSKGNLFKFTEYKKILFIDLTMLPLANMDDLFRLEPPAGVLSLMREREQNYWHGRSLPKEQVQKAIELSRGILGCLLLFTPSLETYAACRTQTSKSRHVHIIYPDEEFFTAMFVNEWTHIHRKYATVPWHFEEEDRLGIRFLHTKPWEDCHDIAEGVDLWRKTAIDLVRCKPELRRCFKGLSWFVKGWTVNVPKPLEARKILNSPMESLIKNTH